MEGSSPSRGVISADCREEGGRPNGLPCTPADIHPCMVYSCDASSYVYNGISITLGALDDLGQHKLSSKGTKPKVKSAY